MWYRYWCALTGVLIAVVLGITAPCADGNEAAPTSQAAPASLREAEALLRRGLAPPFRPGEDALPRRHLKEAVTAFEGALARSGADVRALAGLAEAQMALGDYPAAVRSYQRALQSSPGSRSVRRRLAQALEFQQVAAAAQRALPQGMQVLRVLAYPPGEVGHWAVLSAKVAQNEHADPGTIYRVEYSGLRLELLGGAADQPRPLWHTTDLGHGYTDSFHDVQLYVLNLTRERVPQLVIPEVSVGASWVPSHLDVFTWRGGKGVKLIGARSTFPVGIDDLDHDGRYEVVRRYNIGRTLAHAEQPDWVDIYAYRHGIYQPANARFPRVMRGVAADIRRALASHPDDYELQFYLGRAKEALGNRSAALRSYRRADALLGEKVEANDADRPMYERYREQVRARIRILTR